MWTALAWLLILALLAVATYVFVTPPDVDPTHLLHQGSLAQVRRPHESAVYRSRINEHGRPLLGTGTLESFQLRDVWEPKSFQIASVSADGTETTNEDILGAVERYGPVLDALCQGSERPRILIALNAGAACLSLLFTCLLYGIEPYLVAPSSLEAVQDAVEVVDPAIVVGTNLVGDLNLKEAVPFAVGPGNDKVASLDDMHTREKIPTAPASAQAPTKPAFSFVRGRTVNAVSHGEAGRAIISQMRALEDARWLPTDNVLVFTRELTPFGLLQQLTALSCKAKLIFVKDGFLQPFAVMAAAQPTVVLADDLAIRSVVRLADDFAPLRLVHFEAAKMWLRRGVLPTAVIPEFAPVRLVHTEAVLEEKWGLLTTTETNAARALMGAQVIHSLAVPQSFVPIAQTRVGDYRAGDKVTINFGPVLPGIEAKVTGPDGDNSRGKLSFRFDEWVRTDTEAILRGDGCVYLAAPEPEQSDVFYG